MNNKGVIMLIACLCILFNGCGPESCRKPAFFYLTYEQEAKIPSTGVWLPQTFVYQDSARTDTLHFLTSEIESFIFYDVNYADDPICNDPIYHEARRSIYFSENKAHRLETRISTIGYDNENYLEIKGLGVKELRNAFTIKIDSFALTMPEGLIYSHSHFDTTHIPINFIREWKNDVTRTTVTDTFLVEYSIVRGLKKLHWLNKNIKWELLK